MAKVTFDDKVDLTTKDVPEINKITADNINQLKNGVNSNEVAINAISQGAGTPFDNLADAMVSPLADGQPFFTTVTDKGQYFYDSTTAEGYVLDHLFGGGIDVNTGEFDETSDNPAGQKSIYRNYKNNIKATNNKNLYIKSELIDGAYIKYNNGEITSNASYSYIRIAVEPSTQYTFSLPDTATNNLEQFAWVEYDETYVNGDVAGTKSVTFTTSSSTRYVLLSVNNSFLDEEYQLEKGSVRTDYIVGKLELDVESLLSDESNIVLKEKGKNIFDISSIIDGSFINKNTGVITANAGYSYIFIDLEENTDYNWSLNSDATNNLEQFAYYDESDVFISGEVGSVKSITFNTGANIKKIGLSINNAFLTEKYQLEKGNERSVYQEYDDERKVNVTDLRKKSITNDYLSDRFITELNSEYRKIITCSSTNDADFDNLRDAMESITDDGTKYSIVYDDTEIDLLALYTEAEIKDISFKGFPIKNNVILVCETFATLTGELDDEVYSGADIARVSTINFEGSGGYHNALVTGLNTRYAVHDDANLEDIVRYNKNAHSYKFSGGGYNQSYGGGTRSGGIFVFDGGSAYTEEDSEAFSFHNNTGFTKPSKLYLNDFNCDNASGEIAIRLGSLGSGVQDLAIFKNCYFNGKIRQFEELSNGCGIDWLISGYANTLTPITFETTTSNQYTYNLREETVNKINKGADLVKGDLVYFKNNGVSKMASNHSPTIYFGICMKDCLANEVANIKFKGYINVSDTLLTGLAIGNKIGVVNGVLAVVTSSDYIGVVVSDDFIKLK